MVFRRFRAFRDRWRATHDTVQTMREEVRAARDEAGKAREAATGDEARVASLERHLKALTRDVRRLVTQHRHLLQAQVDLGKAQARSELHGRIGPTTRWVEETPVGEEVLVSVVLPTHDRPELLRRAIRSVIEQRYGHWELLVVDDGDVDVDEVMSSFADHRIRLLRGPRAGVPAARNLALEAARGDLVAYLDDDNRMQPLWLKAVVWAFGQRADADVLYGARVVEDTRGLGLQPDDLFAALQLEPFHRRRLEEANFIDLGTVAHRAGIDEARFDEELLTHGDWDLVLRLTRTRPPFALPVIACSYSTTTPERLEDHPGQRAFHDAVRAKVVAQRPLRVLAYNPMFPLISETYIAEELEALCRVNADVVFARRDVPPTQMPVGRPVYPSLEAALADYDPDLIFLHWLTWAHEQLPVIEATGLPFGVRVHSFDFDPGPASEVAAHPNCLGLWAYPHHAQMIPGARALPTIFTSVDRLPEPSATRDIVLSVSAGLPKKEWPFLVDTMARIEGADRQIILATTLQMEHVPAEVEAMARRHPDPPTVRVDVPRRDVFNALSRAAALVYTLDPREEFGNPMSVVEALCAGTSVILPDRPEARRFAGPAARFSSTGDDIVAHVKEILAGGQGIEDEWATNRAYGVRAFADPALGRRFYSELVEALEGWRAARRVSRPS